MIQARLVKQALIFVDVSDRECVVIMKYVFTLMTRLSLRFRWLTLAGVAVLLVLGVVAVGQLNQELMPPIDFPQTIILAQVSGMDSEQVLSVLTERMEEALIAGADGEGIDNIINLDSQSTGLFGTVLIAYNDFGIDVEKLRDDIRARLDTVWLPQRRIEAPQGSDPEQFAKTLLGDLPSDVILYLAVMQPSFLFQLSPEVWSTLPVETTRDALAYLAQQTEIAKSEKTALELLVEQEIVPQVRTIESVANVSVDGGQTLPGEEDIFGDRIRGEAKSLLLQLSPDVWAVVSPRLGDVGTMDEGAVAVLSAVEITVPEEDSTPPALPESWQQFDYFTTAADLVEIGTLTSPTSRILNDFYKSGKIVGALGQTDDLSVETVRRMLAIEPSMAQFFTADHLMAMPQDVLDVLIENEVYVAGLDGFTRDALAARTLAQSIAAENGGDGEIQRAPVDLPDSWLIQPPRLISFSFADIPLASFSISTSGIVLEGDNDAAATGTPQDAPGESATVAPPVETARQTYEEGPELTPQWALVAVMLRAQMDMTVELNTADDLLKLADEFGGNVAMVLNGMLTVEQAAAFAPGLMGGLSIEAITFVLEHDADAFSGLDAAVWAYLSEEAQALIPLNLSETWTLLASQPQFADSPLMTLDDLLATGDGSAADVLNTINASIPAQFGGYEVRLFDSFTPAMIAYFIRHEPDFYEKLDVDVLLKFSPEVLAALPEGCVANLCEDHPEAWEAIQAIASGEKNSAAAEIAERYASSIPPADPNAPALNAEWLQLQSPYGIELDTADDFFRFPEGYLYENPAALINSVFDSPRGAGFAPDLLGNMPQEAVVYMLGRDITVFDGLISRALQLFTPEVLALMPDALQQRAAAGDDVFIPDSAITRTNGQPSLFLTIYKDAEANTVTTFHAVDDLMKTLDAENDNIQIGIVFEQSSFIEESIAGVAREGGLGAVFAIIIILIFLSSGVWNLTARRRAGVVMVVVFAALLLGLVLWNLDAADGSWRDAFSQSDIVMRVLLVGGIVSGVLALFWPGKLPDPAWRATIVISVSIPLSILTAFVGMRWLSPAMFRIIQPLAEDSSFFAFVLRLFPETLTLNIMTLSGLTVAIGRVVDDSIVVLENIFRQLETEEITPENKRAVVIESTRDVSAAIFIATVVAVVVFLPLGLTGGLIGAFFLPFGLATTYALAGSFIVAVTVVPVLAYYLIDASEIPEEGTIWIADYYLPILRWALRNWKTKLTVLAVAAASFVFGMYLFTQRPAAFIPDMGEPQITISVEMPGSVRMPELNTLVQEMESYLLTTDEIPQDKVRALEVVIGSGGANFESLLMGGSVSENIANITLGLDSSISAGVVDDLTKHIRTQSEAVFNCPGQDNLADCTEDNVVVSSASIASQGMGGFELIVSGPEDTLNRLDAQIIETLTRIEGVTNVTSNRTADPNVEVDDNDPDRVIIRVNQKSSLSYTGELETEDTLGVTQEALTAIESMPAFLAAEGVTVSRGFQSEIQAEGFNSMPVAMGIATVIVIVVLIVTFQSLVYWLALILSIPVAFVGAAVALTLTDRVLGISALIGLLMLLGLVITNAVVLLDRVRSNRNERGMALYEALVEAGGRRLRPILMTSLATIIALIPLAIGLSDGAIIASELGTVVIGGVLSSTLLTLIVVPVMYSILTPAHQFVSRLGRKSKQGMKNGS